MPISIVHCHVSAQNIYACLSHQALLTSSMCHVSEWDYTYKQAAHDEQRQRETFCHRTNYAVASFSRPCFFQALINIKGRPRDEDLFSWAKSRSSCPQSRSVRPSATVIVCSRKSRECLITLLSLVHQKFLNKLALS